MDEETLVAFGTENPLDGEVRGGHDENVRIGFHSALVLVSKNVRCKDTIIATLFSSIL